MMVYDSPSTLRWDAHRPVTVYVYKHFAKKSKENCKIVEKKRGDKLMDTNTTIDASATTPAAPEAAPVVEPSAPTPAVEPAPTPAPTPTHAPTPTPAPEKDKEYEKLQRELADMRAELERAKIRSGLAERKLYPHDMALVERLILEQGGSIEDAIANIYGTRPYLFKVTTVAPSKSSTSSSADDKAANERFLNAVVARICRDNVSLK